VAVLLLTGTSSAPGTFRPWQRHCEGSHRGL